MSIRNKERIKHIVYNVLGSIFFLIPLCIACSGCGKKIEQRGNAPEVSQKENNFTIYTDNSFVGDWIKQIVGQGYVEVSLPDTLPNIEVVVSKSKDNKEITTMNTSSEKFAYIYTQDKHYSKRENILLLKNQLDDKSLIDDIKVYRYTGGEVKAKIKNNESEEDSLVKYASVGLSDNFLIPIEYAQTLCSQIAIFLGTVDEVNKDFYINNAANYCSILDEVVIEPSVNKNLKDAIILGDYNYNLSILKNYFNNIYAVKYDWGDSEVTATNDPIKEDIGLFVTWLGINKSKNLYSNNDYVVIINANKESMDKYINNITKAYEDVGVPSATILKNEIVEDDTNDYINMLKSIYKALNEVYSE